MERTRVNENEVLYMLRQQDDQALKKLLETLRPVFINLWQHLHKTYDGFGQQEACQLATIGLYKGTHAYREEMPMSFRNFVILCAFREMKAGWQKNYRQNCLGSCANLSLDYVDEPGGQYFSEYIADPYHDSDPAGFLRGKFMLEQVHHCLKDGPDLDQGVLVRRLEGYSYKEIAAQLGCSAKDVDNSLQRIRHKISSLFD